MLLAPLPLFVVWFPARPTDPQLVRVAGFEPAVSSSQTRRFPELSYTLLPRLDGVAVCLPHGPHPVDIIEYPDGDSNSGYRRERPAFSPLNYRGLRILAGGRTQNLTFVESRDLHFTTRIYFLDFDFLLPRRLRWLNCLPCGSLRQSRHRV